jgi:alkyldihydroxyacetonephosphate synthase
MSRAGVTRKDREQNGGAPADWMTREIGVLGADVLRAVKATLDPAGILNPGKLIPPPAQDWPATTAPMPR